MNSENKPPGIQKANHFVPQMYLKRWEDSNKKEWQYSLLVPNDKVPIWKSRSVKGIAFHEHLYTRLIAEKQSDEIEKWFNSEFESPAEGSIHKVINDDRLTPEDWNILIRFLAAQDVRTPTRLIEHIKQLKELLPTLLQDVADRTGQQIINANSNNTKLPQVNIPTDEFFPAKTFILYDDVQKTTTLKIETYAGRALWLNGIRFLLNNTIKCLYKHKWTILKPANGRYWFTSDTPVVRLNYFNENEYDLKGGWGKIGTEIFMPISPNHLLYTQVDKKVPPRGTKLSIQETLLIQRFLAENAHRSIFSNVKEPFIENIRPRIVNLNEYNHEKEQWVKWNEDQSTLEKEFMRRVYKSE